MALRMVFLFAVVFSSCLNLSATLDVKGKVSCLDCPSHFNLPGIKVAVKCHESKKPVTATTNKGGLFAVELFSNSPPNCFAKLLGGPKQLYASRHHTVSKIVKVSKSNSLSYTIASPLAFSVSCPSSFKSEGKCDAGNAIGASKTFDLPVPPEWGLAPTSYYIPFFPIIIGIP